MVAGRDEPIMKKSSWAALGAIAGDEGMTAGVLSAAPPSAPSGVGKGLGGGLGGGAGSGLVALVTGSRR